MNEIQEILVSTHGAELQSLVANGREYLWQGDPAFWGRRAPILFPIVGKLVHDTLRIDGAEYRMNQHGFARDSEFMQHQVKSSLFEGGVQIPPIEMPRSYSMQLHDVPSNFPYRFELQACYEVKANALACTWMVENKDEKTMHFQIGAHPAFILLDYNIDDEIHGFIQFYDANENVVRPVLLHYLNDGLRRPYRAPKTLTDGNALLPLTRNTFENDAILIEEKQVASASLLDKNGHRVLTVSCPQADAFGIWAPNKPGCPFVCIEPWCGIADRFDFAGDISEREYNKSLDPGNSYHFHYLIQIHK